jgi:hypothetical protein
VFFNDNGSTAGSANLTFNLNGNVFSVGLSTLVANVSNNSVTVSGNLTATLKSSKDFMVVNTSTTTANTVDLSNSNYFRHTMIGNTTFTFVNAPNSGTAQMFSLLLLNDGVGGRFPTFANTIYWAGGAIPPATTAANARDLWTFITYDGGTTYWGTLTMKDAK